MITYVCMVYILVYIDYIIKNRSFNVLQITYFLTWALNVITTANGQLTLCRFTYHASEAAMGCHLSILLYAILFAPSSRYIVSWPIGCYLHEFGIASQCHLCIVMSYDCLDNITCDIKGQWYGSFYLLWWSYYYLHYKEIVHSISDENKQFNGDLYKKT